MKLVNGDVELANALTNAEFQRTTYGSEILLGLNDDETCDPWDADEDITSELIALIKELDETGSATTQCDFAVNFLACMNFHIKVSKNEANRFVYLCKPKNAW